MIPFEEIDTRLEKIGKDRAWLTSKTPYSADYLRTVLAPNSTRRTERVQKIISDAIEREESEIQSEAVEALKQHAITVYPSREQFNRWTRAFKHSRSETMEDWAERGLDEMAAEWEQSQKTPRVVPFAESAVALFEIPLWHAAAGLPASADVETVDAEVDYGPGRILCELHGDSMEPKFKNGSRVILRTRESLKKPVLKKGEIYLFSIGGQNLLKEYNSRKATPKEIESGLSYKGADSSQKVRILKSINPAHKEIVVAEDVDWIGWLDRKEN